MTLDEAVRRAVEAAPGPVRALAREAGVSHTLLLRIVRGERRATPAVAEALAEALEWWGISCDRASRRLRRAVGGAPERRRRRGRPARPS